MAATYEPIATTTLSSVSSSVSFTSISGSYTDIIAVFNGAASASGVTASLAFNSDSGNNYSVTYLFGTGSSAGSGRFSSIPKIYLSFIAIGMGTAFDANFIAHIQNYSNTTTYKTVLARSNVASQQVESAVGLWRSTNAITSMTFTTNASTFASGSTFTLYGIKAA
jgi:hypothetical protein